MGLAYKQPKMWLQLYWDMLLTQEKREDEGRPGWLRKGEKAVDARDRLKREREEAKRKLGIE